MKIITRGEPGRGDNYVLAPTYYSFPAIRRSRLSLRRLAQREPCSTEIAVPSLCPIPTAFPPLSIVEIFRRATGKFLGRSEFYALKNVPLFSSGGIALSVGRFCLFRDVIN